MGPESLLPIACLTNTANQYNTCFEKHLQGPTACDDIPAASNDLNVCRQLEEEGYVGCLDRLGLSSATAEALWCCIDSCSCGTPC